MFSTIYFRPVGKSFVLFALLIFGSCSEHISAPAITGSIQDSLLLVEMVQQREKAMIEKDLDIALGQFDDSATWINSQGYYFEGKQHLAGFHRMLANNDSLDYYYEAGRPRIRVLDHNYALAYYPWKMFWYLKENPADTINKEIGLMTLNARKMDGQWKWVAVTNQYTPWFHREIVPVTVD